MMGSFITRAVILILGYVYPAYECFKVVERNRSDFEQLRFWCQYWIIIAAFTVFERLGDVLVSWVPMYSEAKLAFIIYLWYPKTQGTTYVYSTFLRHYVVKHEAEIDRQLNELTTRARDLAYFWWQRSSVYIQARFYEVLSYVASQSNRAQQGSVARQGPRLNAQDPPRGPPRDTLQGGSLTHPPPPPAGGFSGSALVGAGYPSVNVDGLYSPAAPQQSPAFYPPPAGQAGQRVNPAAPHSTGSNHRYRETGTNAGSETLLSGDSDSDSDYDVIEHSAENLPEGRLESRSESSSQQANPSVGEQEVPPRVYNTRNRLRSSDSRNWAEWFYSWVRSTSSEKVD
ncbi:hypothetical protein KC19_VG289600 [Ceratodon purpureus]|uniref:HVA22-like protein n=1 Tax=Ceratodon purpureus TaxID=3225 RepID=A0A8T0HUR6_CERPU|nr:hypothetical protein KC19_VG289600 [Ceratodon purpureus]